MHESRKLPLGPVRPLAEPDDGLRMEADEGGLRRRLVRQGHPRDGRRLSEDVAFVVRVAGVGTPTFVPTGIRTSRDTGGIYFREQEHRRQAEEVGEWPMEWVTSEPDERPMKQRIRPLLMVLLWWPR